jgi:amidase
MTLRLKALISLGLALLAFVHLTQAASFGLIDFLASVVAKRPFPDLYEASIQELQTGLDAKQFTSVDLVRVRVPNNVPEHVL